MDKIDKDILHIIHTRRNGEPVGTPTIDRTLLAVHENFILNGLLSEKLHELQKNGLIQSPPNQIGYTLTKKGIEILS